jgi:MFS family permease
LFPLLLVNFIGTLGYSIVLPFLVFLVTDFGGNALIYGVVGAMYPAFQLIGAPILGKWSDAYGRKRILFLSHMGTFLAWVLFMALMFLPTTPLLDVDSVLTGAFVITVPLALLFLARGLDGITGGNVAVANAYLADITKEKDRSRNFGKMSISSNLGFVIGPALAGLLGATMLGELLPIAAALIISAVGLFVIAFYLPETNRCTYNENDGKGVMKLFGFELRKCFEHTDKGKAMLKDVLRVKHVPYLLMLYFLIFLGFNIFYTAFPIRVTTELGWSISDMGIFYAALSLMMVIVQGPVLAKVAKIFSDGALTVIGSLLLGVNFLMLLSGETYIIYLAAVLFALGNGLMWPSFLSILSKTAGKKEQGSVQGVGASFGSMASIVGLIGGGLLFESLGAMTFLVAGGAIFLVFILSLRLLSIDRED